MYILVDERKFKTSSKFRLSNTHTLHEIENIKNIKNFKYTRENRNEPFNSGIPVTMKQKSDTFVHATKRTGHVDERGTN